MIPTPPPEVQARATVRLPPVAVRPVGAGGNASGVAVTGSEISPSPVAFTARTRNW